MASYEDPSIVSIPWSPVDDSWIQPLLPFTKTFGEETKRAVILLIEQWKYFVEFADAPNSPDWRFLAKKASAARKFYDQQQGSYS